MAKTNSNSNSNMKVAALTTFLLAASLPSTTLAAAPKIDLTNYNQVAAATKQMSQNLMGYFNAGKVKELDNDASANGFAWFEVGVFHSGLLEYMKVSGDTTYANQIVNNLTIASYGTVGDFLGTDKGVSALGGKWNDDIMWWNMGPTVAAEMFGAQTIMPGGVSYQTLVTNTLKDVIAEEDNVCNGGIYWIRASSRNGQTTGGLSLSYKSSITNIEYINQAARMGILLGDTTYFDSASGVYNWMRGNGIVRPNYQVFDGMDFINGQCQVNGNLFSYESGMLTGALAWMYKGTQNNTYLQDAHAIFQTGLANFTNPNTGVIFDTCETTNSCVLNQASPKGTCIRGWGYLHEFTNDKNIQAQIKATLQASVVAMMATCDSNWNCGNDWIGKSVPNSYNVHWEINAFELMTAYLKTFYVGPVGAGSVLAAGGSGGGSLTAPNQAPSGNGAFNDGAPPTFTGASLKTSFSIGSALLATIAFSFLL